MQVTSTPTDAPPTASAQAPSSTSVLGALILVQLLFATLPVAGKFVLDELPAFGFAWMRMAGGAVALAAFGVMRLGWGAFNIGFTTIARIGFIGFLGTGLNQLLYLSGLTYAPASHAAVLVCTIPVFTFLFSLLFRFERASWLGTLGVVFSFVGVLSLTGAEQLQLSSDGLVGDLMIIANCAGYAVYLVLIKKDIETYGSMVVLVVSFVVAAIVSAPFCIADLEALPSLSRNAHLLLAYIILGPTIAAYVLNAIALRFASSSTVAIFIYLQPVIGVALAVWLLEEHVGVRAILSIIAVLIGITMVTRARARTAKPSA